MENTCQVCAGTSEHALADTHPFPHSKAFWLDLLHAFLHEISTKIHVENAWTIAALHEGDQHLMDYFLARRYFSGRELWWLNYCCLCLRVTTPSNVTDHGSARLLPEALMGQPDDDGAPAGTPCNLH